MEATATVEKNLFLARIPSTPALALVFFPPVVPAVFSTVAVASISVLLFSAFTPRAPLSRLTRISVSPSAVSPLSRSFVSSLVVSLVWPGSITSLGRILIAWWFSALVLFLPLLVVDEVIKYTCGVFVAVNYLENCPTLVRRNFLSVSAVGHRLVF